MLKNVLIIAALCCGLSTISPNEIVAQAETLSSSAAYPKINGKPNDGRFKLLLEIGTQAGNIPIDESEIVKRCNDHDGCRIVIGEIKRDENYTVESTMFHFYYLKDAANGKYRTGTNLQKTNGDSEVSRTSEFSNCALQDGADGKDDDPEFYLVKHSGLNLDCLLTIMD